VYFQSSAAEQYGTAVGFMVSCKWTGKLRPKHPFDQVRASLGGGRGGEALNQRSEELRPVSVYLFPDHDDDVEYRRSWSDLNAQHASDMLFTHNQILCKEVVRLRYELERASEASDPDSSSSRHGSSPDAGTSRSQSVSPDDVGLRQDADSSMQREALVSSLGRGGQTIAGYMSPQDKVPSCSPPAIPAGMSQLPYSCLSLEGGMEEGEGKVSCQLVEGAALSFAKATVLFASPPSQLGRTYEQLSEWV